MSEYIGICNFSAPVASVFDNSFLDDFALEGYKKISTHSISPSIILAISENSIGKLDYFENDQVVLALKGHLWHNDDYSTICTPNALATAFASGGSSFIENYTGNFALMAYDKKEEKLFLFTDQLKSIPLFVYRTKQGLIFATEYESLRKMAIVDFEVDLKSLSDFMVYGTTLGEETLIKGLTSIAPSSYWVIDHNQTKQVTYSNTITKKPYTVEEAAAQIASNFKELLHSYIAYYGNALQFTLSGGMDSGLVFSAIPDEYKPRVSCLTFYTQNLSAEEDRDVLVARAIQEKYGFEHHVEEIDFFSTIYSPAYLVGNRRFKRKGKILVTGTFGGEFYAYDFNKFLDPSYIAIDKKNKGFWEKLFSQPDPALKQVFSPALVKQLAASGGVGANRSTGTLLERSITDYSAGFFSNIYNGSGGGWLNPYRHQSDSLNPFIFPENLKILFSLSPSLFEGTTFPVHHILYKHHLMALNGVPVNSPYGKTVGSVRPMIEAGSEPKSFRHALDISILTPTFHNFISKYGHLFNPTYMARARELFAEKPLAVSRMLDFENWAACYDVKLPGFK
ncbi:hypothetical protein BH09BAC1_BH09BAC1_20070 [soil metagenome]